MRVVKASGIEDIPENLPLINKAFRSNKFNKIKKAIQLDSSTYNIKVLKLFKKDFYKDFLDDNINENNNDINDTNNEYEIIKDGRKKYYLIKNKLYKIKKDKTIGEHIGEHIGSYINNQIIYN